MTNILTRHILSGYRFAGPLALLAIGGLAALVASDPAAAAGPSLRSPGMDKIESQSLKPMPDKAVTTKKFNAMEPTKPVPTPCKDKANCRRAASLISRNPGYQTCAQLAFSLVDYSEMAQIGNLDAPAEYSAVKKQMIKQHCAIPKGY